MLLSAGMGLAAPLRNSVLAGMMVNESAILTWGQVHTEWMFLCGGWGYGGDSRSSHRDTDRLLVPSVF